MSDPAFDFTKIYADYYPKIQRYLTPLVGEYEAEDLTQEVFVRINQALPTFRGESQLSTWMYRIATNAALDKLRSPSSKRWEFIETLPAITGRWSPSATWVNMRRLRLLNCWA